MEEQRYGISRVVVYIASIEFRNSRFNGRVDAQP